MMWSTTPMAEKFDKLVADHMADDCVLTFEVGKFPIPLTMPKPMIEKGMGGIMASFPNFHFAGDKVNQTADGKGWWTVFHAHFQFDGKAPFAPLPHLPPIEPTGKAYVIGPEIMRIWTNDEDKKEDTDGDAYDEDSEQHRICILALGLS